MSAPYDPGQDTTRPHDGATAWESPRGLVTLTAPSGVCPYYRLAWGSPREQSTAGQEFATAWRKALKREQLLVAGATKKTDRPARDGIAYWLDETRPTPKGGWGASHRSNMEAYADRYFRPTFGKVAHQDLRRSHFQRAVNAAPTSSEGRNVRRAASSLLKALRQGDWLLDSQVIDLSAVWWHGQQQAKDVAEGEDRKFVPLWSRPSHDQVAALRDGAASTGRGQGVWWRGLMVEVAAYAGPRWSELMALDDTTVHRGSRKLDVHWRVD